MRPMKRVDMTAPDFGDLIVYSANDLETATTGVEEV